jgi:hemerythrin-like metal-binding protein
MYALMQDASLGIPEMDSAHQVLAKTLEQLNSTDDTNFPQAYMALVAKLERDFHVEEALMEDYGLACLQLHREQHARVLSGLHQAQLHVMAGDIELGRHALALLPQWLEVHITTMDQALAAELQIAIATNEQA